MGGTGTLGHARCPRCGVRLEEAYKFCPNCAYRLRPDLVTPRPAPAPVPTVGQRILSLGGYLAFASLLLLLALTASYLFVHRSVREASSMEVIPVVRRDPDAIPASRNDFHRVDSGVFYLGAYYASFDEKYDDRNPEIPVELHADDPFEIGVYEVTNDEYYQFLLDRAKNSGRSIPARLLPEGWKRNSNISDVGRIYSPGKGNLPVTDVNFAAAEEFCAWFWETRCGSSPNLLVDVPTAQEYIRAGRGDTTDNFPWGPAFASDKANFIGPLLPVNSKEVGFYRGVYGLVGNAAEWTYDLSGYPAAAGGGLALRKIWDYYSRDATPFEDAGFDPISEDKGNPDLGFRLVIRHVPSLPHFVAVSAGPVRIGVPEKQILHDTGDVASRQYESIRFPPGAVEKVEHGFEIAQSAITNWQYFSYLVDVAQTRRLSDTEILNLYPGKVRQPDDTTEAEGSGQPVASGQDWYRRAVPMAADPAKKHSRPVYEGPYGPWNLLPGLFFWPGEENQPVRGITLEQAQAYAAWLSHKLGIPGRTCRLPTLAEYLRAGRGDASTAYPWGDDPNDQRLVCAGFRDSEERPVSLVGRLHPSPADTVGLCGNVMELVLDRTRKRWLLAGGCYEFLPPYCTLDSFASATWDYGLVEPEGEPPALDLSSAMLPTDSSSTPAAQKPPLKPETPLLRPVRLSVYEGFRVVRVKW